MPMVKKITIRDVNPIVVDPNVGRFYSSRDY
jgi:hypothetical protein